MWKEHIIMVLLRQVTGFFTLFDLDINDFFVSVLPCDKYYVCISGMYTYGGYW